MSRRVKAPWIALPLVLAFASVAGWLGPAPDFQEDVAGARYLPPGTRASAVPIDAHRVWIVTSLEQRNGHWTAERAGQPIKLSARLAAQATPRFYLLGTDALGRDLTSRLLHGSRHSILVALASVLLALVLGTVVGSFSGLAGGVWDALLMRGVDLAMSLPRVLVFLVFASLYRPSTALLVIVLGGTTWPGLARLVRAQTMALRDAPLVHAARAGGVSPARLLLKHILPQLGPILTVTAALRFADTVLLEAALSFIGVGAPPPAVSLGSLIASARAGLDQAWWLLALPGDVLVVLVLGVRSSIASLFRAADPPSVV